MLHRTGILLAVFAFSSSSPLNAEEVNSAYADRHAAAALQRPAANRIHGRVTDVIEAAGYTYAEVDTGKEKVWAATSTSSIKVGDMIAFTTEMPMKDFHSKAMNRDFPVLYFVSRFITDEANPAGTARDIAAAHGELNSAPAAKAIEGINKVEGGNTIAEVYADKQKLDGRSIRVRGQVTKYTADVMGRNWLHIRDSSTPDDLTVTTNSAVAIDAVVVIEGRLALDKDFGYGYVYPLIVQDVTVTTE